MRKLIAGVAMAVALGGAAAAAPASASIEFGDDCVGNQSTESNLVTIFALSSPGALPVAAPVSGVITKLRVNLVPAPVSIPQTMKVLRVIGPSSVLTVAETTGSVTGGGSSFNVRLPVQAGDHLSLYGGLPAGAIYCEVTEEITLAGFEGPGAGPGGTTSFEQEPASARVPLVGVIEPDADHDGFGDETQDKCPQSAAIQTECPVLILDTVALPAKNKVIVLVASSTGVPVTVAASAKLPSAKASAVAKLKPVTHSVTPGKLTRFALNYPASLKSALGSLPAGKKLKLKITASAKDVVGQTKKDKTTLKLNGEG